MLPTKITILGGGVTGLSAAFHLSEKFPLSHITLLERTERLGGWIRSKRVQVPILGGDVGSVLLELGPRTLRPQSKALLELVNVLGLAQQLVLTLRDSPAAKNRFIYIPDARKSGLTVIPSTMLGQFTSKLSLLTIPSIIREPFRRANRPANAQDESLDSFMNRRFGPKFARTLGSALVHGVYAADSRKLSIRAAFGSLWDAETLGDGSIIRGLYKSRRMGVLKDSEQYETGDLEPHMRNVSVYSFRDGLETLVDALRRKLEAAPNVQVKTGVQVTKIDPIDDTFKISTSCGPLDSSHVVAAIPLPRLQSLISNGNLPHLTFNPSSSVTVASFVFARSPSYIHPQGFGYLIPRPRDGYDSPANPEGVLGVVFDSCSLDAQDRPRGSLTKMTMMVGGPYPQPSADPEEMGGMLLEALQRHLGKRLPDPVHVEVARHEDCIPLLAPGHLSRMEDVNRALQEEPWGGKMEVIGAGVGGVSVSDCVEQGRQAGWKWSQDA